MPTVTCLHCRHPLPPNATLTSLPAGVKFVCDPKAGRVWTVCGRCREWNLAGTETAQAFLREVVPRLPRALGATTPSGYFTLGDIEVLAINQGSTETLPSRSGVTQYRLLRRYGWLANLSLYLMLVVFNFGPNLFRPSKWQSGQLHLVAVMIAGVGFGRYLVNRRAGRRGGRWGLAVGLVTTTALAYGFPWFYDGMEFLGPGMLAALIAMWAGSEVLLDSWTLAEVGADGRARIRPVNLRRVLLGLSMQGALEVRVGGARGRILVGADAERALVQLSGGAVGITDMSREALDEGWLLSRLHPTPQRLMQAWLAADANRRDRVELLELPNAWQVALYIVCMEATAPGKDVEELRERLAAASSLAAVAEQLDDDVRGES